MITALTPASFSAFEVSIFLIRACACGLLSTSACKLTGEVVVGAVLGAAGHLVDAIGAQRAGADECELLVFDQMRIGVLSHQAVLLMSAAASSTALTILS